MIGWMLKNFISNVENVVLKMYKTLIRLQTEYWTQVWATVLRHGNWLVKMRLIGKDIKRIKTKIAKRIKD